MNPMNDQIKTTLAMSGDFYYDKVSVAMLVRLLLCLFNYLFDNSTIAMLA